MKRKTITLEVTISAPAWLSPKDAAREVRTLISESTVYGTLHPRDPYTSIDHGDLKARRVRTIRKAKP